jgi:16S rRNA C1402 (ribose-2'-O) methylase RsmI
MWYVLIGLSLSLAGVAGLQFFYMVYLERLEREHKKRIRELERHTKYLSNKLHDAETRVAEQKNLLESFFDELEDEEDVWADVIEDR